VVGQVLCGINNIYTVSADGRRLRCRIKGKVLQDDLSDRALQEAEVFADRKLKMRFKAYNPIAVGDWVEIRPDPHDPATGWIESVKERRSFLVRFNKKKQALQVLAANTDVLVCVGSAKSPPFRPRFIDRLLVSAQVGGVEPLVFINKSDLGLEREDRARLAALRRSGYTVLAGSALKGKGLGELRNLLRGRDAAFVGQSGVGKSSLLNRLDGSLGLKVGEISRKHNRGGHVTSHAVLLELGFGARIVDTPGIRELDVYGIAPEELALYFPDFRRSAERCGYASCCHLDEPDCGVKADVESGKIHPDRYLSYVSIYSHLRDFQQSIIHGRPTNG
jgi:ribosome biogenesis GTPase